MKVYFIGAGPGDPELITVKGARLLAEADVVIYAGSLVNPAVLRYAAETAERYDSAGLTLEEIMGVMERSVRAGKTVARLHSGDPSLYGAIGEQMDRLAERGIPYEVVPGVSSCLAAAATLGREFTVPGGTQTLILTRIAGRTPVPPAERLGLLAAHRASMAVFLSVHLIEEVASELAEGYPPLTPVAVVEKASWPTERVVLGTVADIAAKVKEAGIERTALVLVGDFLAAAGARSGLYDPGFSHGWRRSEG